MPIHFISGDLFVNKYNVQAFAHGCNCKGSMGAGIAVGFRERYPEMYEEYRQMCKAVPRQFNIGDAYLWKEANKPWVFNLGTQEDYWQSKATYEAIEQSLINMKAQATKEQMLSIAMPRIGAGYGGLSWKKVRVVIEKVFKEWIGDLYIYEEFVVEN